MKRYNPELAPKGVPVIIAGGVAMKKTGEEWYTGMEEPLFQRRLEWDPNWWSPIPNDNRHYFEKDESEES